MQDLSKKLDKRTLCANISIFEPLSRKKCISRDHLRARATSRGDERERVIIINDRGWYAMSSTDADECERIAEIRAQMIGDDTMLWKSK